MVAYFCPIGCLETGLKFSYDFKIVAGSWNKSCGLLRYVIAFNAGF